MGAGDSMSPVVDSFVFYRDCIKMIMEDGRVYVFEATPRNQIEIIRRVIRP